MLDYFFGEKHLYVDDANRIGWSCDESVIIINDYLKSSSDIWNKLSICICKYIRERPLAVLINAGPSIACFSKPQQKLKVFGIGGHKGLRRLKPPKFLR